MCPGHMLVDVAMVLGAERAEVARRMIRQPRVRASPNVVCLRGAFEAAQPARFELALPSRLNKALLAIHGVHRIRLALAQGALSQGQAPCPPGCEVRVRCALHPATISRAHSECRCPLPSQKYLA